MTLAGARQIGGAVIDESATLDEALRNLYAEHALPADGGESARWFHVRIGPLRLPMPNPPARQRAIFIHDVNHVLTGYNAVFSDGEMSIAAFEVGAGCGRVWVAWVLNLPLMALGAIVRPRVVFRAFARGRRTESLYTRSDDRVALRGMRVAELRRLIRLDTDHPVARPGDVAVFVAFVVLTWLAIAVVPVAAVVSLFAI